jgi:hypothetical protein
MADSIIGVLQAASPDKKLDTTSLTVGANTVERERVNVSGAAATELADVKGATPASTLFGLVVRPLPMASTTAGACAQTSIGTTSSSALASNASRVRFRTENTGLTVIYLGFGQTPTVTAYHMALAPCSNSANDGTGGTTEWDDNWKGAVNAISSAAGGTLVTTELT